MSYRILNITTGRCVLDDERDYRPFECDTLPEAEEARTRVRELAKLNPDHEHDEFLVVRYVDGVLTNQLSPRRLE